MGKKFKQQEKELDNLRNEIYSTWDNISTYNLTKNNQISEYDRFLNSANTSLTAVGLVKTGQEGLIKILTNSKSIPAVNSYFSWYSKIGGVASLTINYGQYKQAKKNNDQLGQKRAKAEATSNFLISTGNPFLTGIGLGGHLSLFLNPTMEDPKNHGYGHSNNEMCFIAGTLISMADGSQKNIEDVKTGDNILSYNFNSKNTEVVKIKKIANPIHDKLVKIIFENEMVNTNTIDHPYYVIGKCWASFNPKLKKSTMDLKLKS